MGTVRPLNVVTVVLGLVFTTAGVIRLERAVTHSGWAAAPEPTVLGVTGLLLAGAGFSGIRNKGGPDFRFFLAIAVLGLLRIGWLQLQ